MSAKYKIGDRVRILGFIEPCDFMYYNDDDEVEDNMDTCVGHIGEIIHINDRGHNNYSYIISGCGRWQWVDQWIELYEEDQLPDIVSVEDFEMVVFS